MRRKSSSTKHAFIIMLIVDGSGNKMKFNYLHASRQASFCILWQRKQAALLFIQHSVEHALK